MAPFKVVIVGGSVAGLALANTLERYHIDYVLLEKHHDLAPQLGASLGLWPYGLRILEQLGIYEEVRSVSMPMSITRSFDPQGCPLTKEIRIGDLLEETIGDRMWFLDRQQLLQAMLNNIKDKSKILKSHTVCKIENLDGSVKVVTKDGSSFYGDIVVGADGVHSRVRQEIWRLMDLEVPNYQSSQSSESIICFYRCMFGISDRPGGFPDDHGYKTFKKNHSYLYQAGKDSKLYWFAFFRNSVKTVSESIPRYTAEDADTLAAEYADDIIFEGLTFGDIYKRRRHSVLVPLEEFVLDKCFYKRAILIGDSFHKMNPLTGQGGNSAIESAAILADMLKEALEQSPSPNNETIQHLFSDFQQERQIRTRPLMKGSRDLQRLDALENPLSEFLTLKVLSKMGPANFGPRLAEAASPGHRLRYASSKFGGGIVALDSDVVVNPQQRSTPTTAVWMIAILLTFVLRFSLMQYLENAEIPPTGESMGSVSGVLRQELPIGPELGPTEVLKSYISVITFAINGIWVVESYRFSFLITPLFSAIPFAFASSLLGWDISVSIYFAIYIYFSGNKSFYYPLPRAINLWVAKYLPIAFLAAYALPILQCVVNMTSARRPLFSIATENTFLMAHISLPIMLYMSKTYSAKDSPETPISDSLFGVRDKPYLLRFFHLLFFLAVTTHLAVVAFFVPHAMSHKYFYPCKFSAEWTHALSLGITLMVWCLFTLWDMRRVNIISVPFTRGLLLVTSGSIILGPAAVMTALWSWRESMMEDSRKKRSDVR